MFFQLFSKSPFRLSYVREAKITENSLNALVIVVVSRIFEIGGRNVIGYRKKNESFLLRTEKGDKTIFKKTVYVIFLAEGLYFYVFVRHDAFHSF